VLNLMDCTFCFLFVVYEVELNRGYLAFNGCLCCVGNEDKFCLAFMH